MSETLKAPFPWFGGKSRVAAKVWERFGDVPNYVEPFFGSGAVLLGRPHPPRVETVNDLDCMVANFWRALQHDPDGVAEYADHPVNEADQHARHLWLCSRAAFRERMKTEPEFYDVQIAGWWVWGQSIWLGGGWCHRQFDESEQGATHAKRPSLATQGKGVLRKFGDDGPRVLRRKPHISGQPRGVWRQMPSVSSAGQGVMAMRAVGLTSYMRELAVRLYRTRVICGDWSRCVTPSVTVGNGLTGVLLDPPYAGEVGRDTALYAEESLTVAHDVRAWAVANGGNPLLRIALCGYEGEHDMPSDWDCVAWKAAGGYGSGKGNAAEANARRERVWFSPHCLQGTRGLFDEVRPEETVG